MAWLHPLLLLVSVLCWHLAVFMSVEGLLVPTSGRLLQLAVIGKSILGFGLLYVYLTVVSVVSLHWILMGHKPLWGTNPTVLWLIVRRVCGRLVLYCMLIIILGQRELWIGGNLIELLIVWQENWVVEPEVVRELHSILNLFDVLIEVVAHRPDADGATGGAER